MAVAVRSVSASEYLREILSREAVDYGRASPLLQVESKIAALCGAWGGRHVAEVTPGGGFAKGTANRSGINIDYVVWIHPQSERRIPDIYESMFSTFGRLGLAPARRHVSMALTVGDAVVDLMPVRRLSMVSDSHEIYSARRNAAITTNLHQHVREAHDANLQEEIRILKLWRDQNGLDFPSYHLELAVSAALRRQVAASLADNVWVVLGFLEKLLVPRALLDPANAANIVSDELSGAQRREIAKAAADARNDRPWSEIVW